MINPDYYKKECSIECIEALRLILGTDGLFHFCMGNAFKYLWRHKYKNGKEDLEKAEWYLKACQILYPCASCVIEDASDDRIRILVDMFNKYNKEYREEDTI